jgi:hypothetical protein
MTNSDVQSARRLVANHIVGERGWLVTVVCLSAWPGFVCLFAASLKLMSREDNIRLEGGEQHLVNVGLASYLIR